MCLKTMRSCNFPIRHKRETGLKLDGSEVSPFFDKGITCECFQMSANLPSLKDLLNKILNGTETSLAMGFKILLLIPCGLLALLGFSISIKDCIFLGCILYLSIYFDISTQTLARDSYHHLL